MSRTHLVFSCAHSDPSVGNDRFDWLGAFIYDVKPDVVVDLGDFDDMRSLNSYDSRYPLSVVSQSYESDILTGQDARDRLWHKFRHMKRRKPYRVGIMGNHEYRITKAVAENPRIEGKNYGISLKHLQTDHWYDEYHEYVNEAPALVDIDGITYSHFIASGSLGRAVYNKHLGSALLERLSCSVTVGHNHEWHHYSKLDARPYPIHGCSVGCYKGKEETWAGHSNAKWWRGVVLKEEVENGHYDIKQFSINWLRKHYKVAT